ncbi:hypothetical protein [Streptomyces olivoreticuli]|uniref:hypothetical protein n=1 Tax=Streptomyces olivoreticuli TaxID=68246 RepID=UPI0013C33F39|nr:hypothetical protein [Streptomyces olivoreticuli]
MLVADIEKQASSGTLELSDAVLGLGARSRAVFSDANLGTTWRVRDAKFDRSSLSVSGTAQFAKAERGVRVEFVSDRDEKVIGLVIYADLAGRWDQLAIGPQMRTPDISVFKPPEVHDPEAPKVHHPEALIMLAPQPWREDPIVGACFHFDTPGTTGGRGTTGVAGTAATNRIHVIEVGQDNYRLRGKFAPIPISAGLSELSELVFGTELGTVKWPDGVGGWVKDLPVSVTDLDVQYDTRTKKVNQIAVSVGVVGSAGTPLVKLADMIEIDAVEVTFSGPQNLETGITVRGAVDGYSVVLDGRYSPGYGTRLSGRFKLPGSIKGKGFTGGCPPELDLTGADDNTLEIQINPAAKEYSLECLLGGTNPVWRLNDNLAVTDLSLNVAGSGSTLTYTGFSGGLKIADTTVRLMGHRGDISWTFSGELENLPLAEFTEWFNNSFTVFPFQLPATTINTLGISVTNSSLQRVFGFTLDTAFDTSAPTPANLTVRVDLTQTRSKPEAGWSQLDLEAGAELQFALPGTPDLTLSLVGDLTYRTGADPYWTLTGSFTTTDDTLTVATLLTALDIPVADLPAVFSGIDLKDITASLTHSNKGHALALNIADTHIAYVSLKEKEIATTAVDLLVPA